MVKAMDGVFTPHYTHLPFRCPLPSRAYYHLLTASVHLEFILISPCVCALLSRRSCASVRAVPLRSTITTLTALLILMWLPNFSLLPVSLTVSACHFPRHRVCLSRCPVLFFDAVIYRLHHLPVACGCLLPAGHCRRSDAGLFTDCVWSAVLRCD